MRHVLFLIQVVKRVKNTLTTIDQSVHNFASSKNIKLNVFINKNIYNCLTNVQI